MHREATERGSRSRKRTMVARVGGSVGSGRAEDEALARARAWLGHQRAAILTATGDGICGLDADGRVTFSNPALHRLLGRSACTTSSTGVTTGVRTTAAPPAISWLAGR